MKNIFIIFYLCLVGAFAQSSRIDVSGTSSIYLNENNTICADDILIEQGASFTAEFYGDVYEGDCSTTLVPTGSGTITLPVETFENESLPTKFTLEPAYPNPFNPSTIIQYGIPDMRNVLIEIYDLRGRKIVALLNNQQEPGWYEITWNGLLSDGNIAPSGIYLYKIRASNEVKIGKFSLIR